MRVCVWRPVAAQDLERYRPLAQQLSRENAEGRGRILEALADINVAKGPSRYIREYAVQELLGKGAFGSVYSVKKDAGETLFALKQLPLDEMAADGGFGGGGGGLFGVGGGGSEADAAQSANYLKREVQILSTLQHPNIINYYESFTHNRSLCIVMELVEGATLLDHINSLAEKGLAFAEQRIWSIFTQVSPATAHRQHLAASPRLPVFLVSCFASARARGDSSGSPTSSGALTVVRPTHAQVCLALRYIHKEKNVVHRDLTPSNIMINVDGDVKLADFGLARQRLGTNSVMESVVGSVLYQCPELIQHEAYSEKADIWRPAVSGYL